jgi:predicted kinase
MNTQLKIMVLKGAPASGKSSFARELMAKEIGQWKRISNDGLRDAIDFSIYSPENEKIIRSMREHMLKDFLRKGYNCIIDNVNASKRNFDDVVKIVSKLNLDVQIFEKAFYCPLPELIERDSKRVGNTKVGEEVVRKFFNNLGKDQFKFYKPRHEVFSKRKNALDRLVEPIEQNKELPRAVVFDNDGTISIIHKDRSPYNAETCDQDHPNDYVIECMRMYFRAGYKILFVSGREEKDRAPTERFYEKHFPEVEYELYMRPTGSNEKDVIVKERIYNENIKGRYYVAGWYDDRHQIVKWLYENGFPVFRVGDPEASF